MSKMVDARPLEISQADFDAIAEAGDIKNGQDPFESEIPDLMRALVRWKRNREILLQAKKDNLSPKQQLDLVREFAGLLERLANFIDGHPQLRSLLTVAAQRRADKELTGADLDNALDRIPNDVRRCLQLGGLRDLVESCIAESAAEPVLPSTASAAKPSSDDLSFGILLYLGFRGRLGDQPPTSDTDQRVAFASAVVEFIERDSFEPSAARTHKGLRPSAVRHRLAPHFERAKLLSTPRPPRLEAEREARAAWVSRAFEEARKIPTLSDDDAREIADGLSVDLTMDPRDVVRRFKATWNE